MWIIGYETHGFTFMLSNTGGGEEGVIVPPTADLYAPGFIHILKRAQLAWGLANEFMTASMLGYNSGYTKSRIEEIIAAVESDGGFEISQQMIDNLRSKWTTQQERTRPQKRKRSGYVYLVQSSTGYYKIGRTSDPKNRAKTFGIQLPFEISFIALIQTDDMFSLESELHDRYQAGRVNGEWFALAPKDVDYIKGLAQ